MPSSREAEGQACSEGSGLLHLEFFEAQHLIGLAVTKPGFCATQPQIQAALKHIGDDKKGSLAWGECPRTHSKPWSSITRLLKDAFPVNHPVLDSCLSNLQILRKLCLPEACRNACNQNKKHDEILPAGRDYCSHCVTS